MKIETIGAGELKSLYDARLREDFPPSELRPYSNMKYLLDLGAYRCFVYREQKELLGYALFAVWEGAALLDYLAVTPFQRGKGVGTRFLRELKPIASDFGAAYGLIEAENPDRARTPEQLEERRRRLRFYAGCGCRPSGVFSLLFGVEYQILVWPFSEDARPSPEEVKSSLDSLYRLIVPPIVKWDETAYRQACRCFLQPDGGEAPTDFARLLGHSLTWLTRNRKRYMGERLREYGFSGPMYMILLHVDRHPGATQDSIATHMYIDKSNVARRIKQLEELGYIRRETDLSDRRQNNLYLTGQGKELAPLIRSYLSQWGQSIASDLSENEKSALLDLLAKMTGLGQA